MLDLAEETAHPAEYLNYQVLYKRLFAAAVPRTQAGVGLASDAELLHKLESLDPDFVLH